MSMSHLSIRTHNQNMLMTKIKPFRENYSQSLARNKQKSSMHNLAGTVYSKQSNRQFTPQKTRPPSAHNPETKLQSIVLKGLNMRASHVPSLSDFNTQLLIEKRKLQERVMFLKEEIAKETRLKNKADEKWKMDRNEKDKCNELYQDHCKKSAKLNEAIVDTRNECSQLKSDVDKLKMQNIEKVSNIQKEENNVNFMDNRVKTLKNNLMQEQKQRNYVKGELLKQQRVMASASIVTKQLQNQRAMLLLEINETVHRNKL